MWPNAAGLCPERARAQGSGIRMDGPRAESTRLTGDLFSSEQCAPACEFLYVVPETGKRGGGVFRRAALFPARSIRLLFRLLFFQLFFRQFGVIEADAGVGSELP